MSRRVMVTGGAGFIGANLVHYWLSEFPEDTLVVVDALTYSGNLKNLDEAISTSQIEFIKLDITDEVALQKLILDREFTHIAHLAAESHVDRSIHGPEQFIKTNVIGTFNLLESLRAAGWSGRDDRLLLHVSTDEVYGSLGPTGYFSETTPYQPNSPYSASKAASDHLVRAYWHTYRIPAVTTNCSNNFGPYQFPEKLIPLIVLNCVHGRPLPVYGTGENVRDWLYVRDHAVALELAIRKGQPGRTYNIGSRNELQNIELVKMICDHMDVLSPDSAPHSRLIMYVKDRPGHDHRYAIDPTRAESELGWKPQYNFAEALKSTVEWYLGKQDWWKDILSGEYAKYYEHQYQKR